MVYFIQVAIGGPFVGFIFAKITLWCLSRIFNDALAEITITLAATYITYYVGLYQLPKPRVQGHHIYLAIRRGIP